MSRKTYTLTPEQMLGSYWRADTLSKAKMLLGIFNGLGYGLEKEELYLAGVAGRYVGDLVDFFDEHQDCMAIFIRCSAGLIAYKDDILKLKAVGRQLKGAARQRLDDILNDCDKVFEMTENIGTGDKHYKALQLICAVLSRLLEDTQYSNQGVSFGRNY